MTALTLNRSSGSLFLANSISTGTSSSALAINETLVGIARRWQESVTSKLKFSELEQQLLGVLEACSVENWDGYDAKPISPAALGEAKQLLAVIPTRLLPNEIVAEPHGGIALYWAKRGRVLILSVNGTKTIEYAITYGPIDEDAGKRSFAGLLPSSMLELIASL